MASSCPYKYIGADSVASSPAITSDPPPPSHRRPQRHHRRFDVDVPAAIAGHESRARCTSLGTDGMFLTTRERLAVGKQLLVRLYLPGRLRLVIPAAVCATTHAGTELSFAGLEDAEASTLASYLAALRADRR